MLINCWLTNQSAGIGTRRGDSDQPTLRRAPGKALSNASSKASSKLVVKLVVNLAVKLAYSRDVLQVYVLHSQ